MDEKEIKPKSVKILLSQHIGAPDEAIVARGDKVEAGQQIAKAQDGKLGVNIHTPFAGTVAKVTDKYVKVTL